MLPILPYRKPQLGRDYWVQDDFLPNAQEISQRCYTQDYWELGAPTPTNPGRESARRTRSRHQR